MNKIVSKGEFGIDRARASKYLNIESKRKKARTFKIPDNIKSFFWKFLFCLILLLSVGLIFNYSKTLDEERAFTAEVVSIEYKPIKEGRFVVAIVTTKDEVFYVESGFAGFVKAGEVYKFYPRHSRGQSHGIRSIFRVKEVTGKTH